MRPLENPANGNLHKGLGGVAQNRLFLGLFLVEFFVFLAKALNAAGRVDQFLLTGVKRMAL